jgi:hypothetical protein
MVDQWKFAKPLEALSLRDRLTATPVDACLDRENPQRPLGERGRIHT